MKNVERQEENGFPAVIQTKLTLTWIETVAVEKKKNDENNVYFWR